MRCCTLTGPRGWEGVDHPKKHPMPDQCVCGGGWGYDVIRGGGARRRVADGQAAALAREAGGHAGPVGVGAIQIGRKRPGADGGVPRSELVAPQGPACDGAANARAVEVGAGRGKSRWSRNGRGGQY